MKILCPHCYNINEIDEYKIKRNRLYLNNKTYCVSCKNPLNNINNRGVYWTPNVRAEVWSPHERIVL